jgi:hypothetical protein
MSIKNSLNEIIFSYDKDISNYLMSPNFVVPGKSETCNIVESIQQCIYRALNNAPEDMEFQKNPTNNPLEKCDYIYFGDIHGQLDLFLQNLYVAKIINKDGCLRDNMDKKLIQLGDTIDVGDLQWETLVFLRMLKNEAIKKNVEFHYLIGNKEISYVLNTQDLIRESIMGKMIKSDIENDVLKLSFSPPDKNIISFHSSMEKNILVDSLLLMCDSPEFKTKMLHLKPELQNIKELLKKKHKQYINGENSMKSLESLHEKTSSQRIYQTLYKNGISLNDFSIWLNDKFKNLIKDGSLAKDSPYYRIFVSSSSLTHSKRKATKERHHEANVACERKFLIDKSNIKYSYKPIQISGHKQTVFGVSQGVGNKGGIMQNRANIFADCGLTSFYGGFQAFVGLNSKNGNLYAVELLDNGKTISGLTEAKQPISLSKKSSYFKVRILESLKAHDKAKFIPK